MKIKLHIEISKAQISYTQINFLNFLITDRARFLIVKKVITVFVELESIYQNKLQIHFK